MPLMLECSSCKRQLRVPENLLGKKVQCPSCGLVFVAEDSAAGAVVPSPPPLPGAADADSAEAKARIDAAEKSAVPGPEPADRPISADEFSEHLEPCPACGKMIRADATRCQFCDAYLGEGEGPSGDRREPYRRLRRDSEPHRGSLVLTLGIISLATCFMCGLPGLAMGLTAWIMGVKDLKKIRANLMDPEGKGQTQAGMICGIIGTFINALAAFVYICYFVFVVYMVQTTSRVMTGSGAVVRTMPAPARPSVRVPAGELSLDNVDDYADARKKFATKLQRFEKPPQDWQPVIAPAGVTEVEFPSGGLRLKAWINRPPQGAPKKPAVLFLHGGWSFDLADWTMAQPYVDAGYVVMAPRLRAENGQAGNWSFFYDEVDDVLAAADFLAKEPSVDPKRIFVAGHEVGGTLTLLAALASDRFKGAASFSGSPDQLNYLRNRVVNVPFDSTDMQELQMRSPLCYADDFKCPVRAYLGNQELPYLRLATSKMVARAQAKELDVASVTVAGNEQNSPTQGIPQSIEFFKKLQKRE